MSTEHTAPVPRETRDSDSSLSFLMLTIKASGVLTVVGLAAGIALTVVWISIGGGDSIAFAALATVYCLIMGGLFGTLGSTSVYLLRKALHNSPWFSAVAFAAPGLVIMLLTSVFSLNLKSVLTISAVTIALILFGRWYVAPRLSQLT